MKIINHIKYLKKSDLIYIIAQIPELKLNHSDLTIEIFSSNKISEFSTYRQLNVGGTFRRDTNKIEIYADKYKKMLDGNSHLLKLMTIALLIHELRHFVQSQKPIFEKSFENYPFGDNDTSAYRENKLEKDARNYTELFMNRHKEKIKQRLKSPDYSYETDTLKVANCSLEVSF